MLNKKGQAEAIISAFGVGIIIIILLLLFGSFYTIQAGQRGVLLTFGEADSNVKTEGLHTKWPLVQTIIKYDIRTQKYEADASAASKDLQIVTAKIATNYRVIPDKIVEIYQKVGLDYATTIIMPAEQEVVKSITAQFTAEELITKREEARLKMKDLLTERMKTWNIVVEEVSIVNFDFSKSFNDAIESKVTAEQLKLKADRDLERIKVEAEQIAASAEGQKKAKIASAEGDAQAINLINQQLTSSPQYIEYYKLQKWNGVLPQVVTSDSATPLVSIN